MGRSFGLAKLFKLWLRPQSQWVHCAHRDDGLPTKQRLVAAKRKNTFSIRWKQSINQRTFSAETEKCIWEVYHIYTRRRNNGGTRSVIKAIIDIRAIFTISSVYLTTEYIDMTSYLRFWPEDDMSIIWHGFPTKPSNSSLKVARKDWLGQHHCRTTVILILHVLKKAKKKEVKTTIIHASS